MKAEVSFNMGACNYKFYIDEEKEKEALNKAIVLGNPPRYCDVCKNTQFFKLETNKAKSKDGKGPYTYINCVCMKAGCFAKAQLGEYESGGFFWKKFEKYQKTTEVNQEQDSADYFASLQIQSPPQ